MRPKKKRIEHAQPDAIKDEAVETIGGTNGEALGDDEDWGRTVEGEAGGYGRLEELGEEDEYI